MNYDEIVDLLTLAAVYDQRTGGEADVRGWHAVAQLERWTAAAAQRVVIEHYSRGAERPRITPAAISDGIRVARRKAAASFVAPAVPDDVAGRDYPVWYRAQLAAHVDRMLDMWAQGEPIPESPAELEAQRGQRELPEGIDAGTCPEHLREQLELDMARFGRMDRLPRRAPAADADGPDGRQVEDQDGAA
jgi:hypothetical protein